MDRGAWQATVHGVARVRHDLVTKPPPWLPKGKREGEGRIKSMELTHIHHYTLNRLPWWLRWERICLQCGRPGFDPWIGKIPWGRAWQHPPVFLTGESPWTEESGGLQSMGSKRVRHDCMTNSFTLSLLRL